MLASIPASIDFALNLEVINEIIADVLQHEVESMEERSEKKRNFVTDNTEYLNQLNIYYLANFAKWKKKVFC